MKLFIFFITLQILAWSAVDHIFITNTSSDSVTEIINDETTIMEHNYSVQNYPIGVAVLPDGSKVYVANNEEPSVSVIDRSSTPYTITHVTNNIGPKPYGVAAAPNGQKIYVTNYTDNSLSIIDTSTDTATKVSNIGSGPLGVVVSSDSSMVYLTLYQANRVVRYDTVNDQIGTLANISSPWGIDISPDDSKLYVGSHLGRKLYIINLDNNNSTQVDLGERPYALVYLPSRHEVYITKNYNNSLTIYKEDTNQTIQIDNICNNPKGISRTPDDRYVYIACQNDDVVTIFDTENQTVVRTIPTGDGPIAFGKFIFREISSPQPQVTVPLHPLAKIILILSFAFSSLLFLRSFRKLTT